MRRWSGDASRKEKTTRIAALREFAARLAFKRETVGLSLVAMPRRLRRACAKRFEQEPFDDRNVALHGEEPEESRRVAERHFELGERRVEDRVQVIRHAGLWLERFAERGPELA